MLLNKMFQRGFAVENYMRCALDKMSVSHRARLLTWSPVHGGKLEHKIVHDVFLTAGSHQMAHE